MPILRIKISEVVNFDAGIKPPRIALGFRTSTARGATCTPQYGHTRSLVVMNARQFGHILRFSAITWIRSPAAGPRDLRSSGGHGQNAFDQRSGAKARRP